MIGNGNVALDVARMLALTPEELAPTDTTDPAIEAIGASAIRDIVVVGRRGPAQASWTTQELKELGELAGADVVVDPAELELDPASEASLEHDTNSKRNMEVLRDFASREPTGKPVTVRLRFLASPVALHGDHRVESIELVRNRLEEQDGRLVAVPTDEHETLECGLVFRSVGYRGVGLPELPFDERRGTIRTTAAASSTATARTLPRPIAPAGSSAARPGSSARTRRTRPRRSRSCSRTSTRAGSRTATR